MAKEDAASLPQGDTIPTESSVTYCEILAGAISRISPHDRNALRSLPADFLLRLVAAVADETQAVTVAQLDAQESVRRHNELAALDQQLEDIVDDCLEFAEAMNKRCGRPPVAWPLNFRAELVEQLRKGSDIQLDALRTASQSGHLKGFMDSRLHPEFSVACKSVTDARSAKMQQPLDLSKAESLFREVRHGVDVSARFAEIFADEESAISEVVRDLHQLFFHDLPKTLLRYWLPLALWTLSSKAALDAIRALPAAQPFDDAFKAALARRFAAAFGLQVKPLLSALSKSQAKTFTVGNFNKTVSALKLHRIGRGGSNQPRKKRRGKS